MAEEEKEVKKSKAELIQEKAAKKAEKVAAKEAKRREKLIKKGIDPDDPDFEDDGGVGGKLAIFLATVIIIAIWMGILILVIKWDVGGFGSSVLYPIMKDVPYLNKILPSVEYEFGTENTEYQFDSLDEAVNRIKELETLLDEANSSSSKRADKVKQLKEQIAELSVYKEEQAEFEKQKEKYYEEVVFSDNAPDINEYKAYYESIDPANAEVLYKQVVEQLQHDEEVKEYAETYSAMKPKAAAAIFNTMTGDLKLVASILQNMDAQSRADILGKMDADIAAKVTAIMEP